MIRAVFDANLLVSAFLSRNNPSGVSNEIIRFVIAGAIELCLSAEIIDEAIGVLANSPRLVVRYDYLSEEVDDFRVALTTLCSMIADPPSLAGAVPRDADDDKVVACAVVAETEYIVTRDHDLLSLRTYGAVEIVSPEQFLSLVRAEYGRLPD